MVRSWRGVWGTALPLCALWVASGCAPAGAPADSAFPEQVLSSLPVPPSSPARYGEAEPNNDYDRAQPVVLSAATEVIGSLAGASAWPDDDLYDLGEGAAGDRIVAELTVRAPGDVVLGLLDGEARLLGMVSSSGPGSGSPTLEVVLREPTAQIFAAVAARTPPPGDVPYSVNLAVERAGQIPAPVPQIIVLDFQGGQGIRIASRAPVDIPPFDAAVISPSLAGQTDVIIQHVFAMVLEDYAGLDVSIHVAGDAGIPFGERSVIYFGTSDDRLLGLADNVDPYNGDPSQSAIIFTDTFALFDLFSPTAEEIAQVLANVASHEAGHLLGLRHTAHPLSIMDVTATARQMLADQSFSTFELEPSVMPLGFQDAPALLSWTVGGALVGPSPAKLATQRRVLSAAADPDDFYIPRGQLATCSCHGCTPPESELPAESAGQKAGGAT